MIMNNLPMSGDNLSDNIFTYFCAYPQGSFRAPSMGAGHDDYIFFNQSASSDISGGFYLRKKMKTRLKTYLTYSSSTVKDHYTYILEPGYVYTYTIYALKKYSGYYRSNSFLLYKYDITNLNTSIDSLSLHYAADEEINGDTMFRLEKV